MIGQHNLFADLLGAVTLPLLLVLALGIMAGAKPDAVCKGYFGVAGLLLQGTFRLAGVLLALFIKALPGLLEAGRKAVEEVAQSASKQPPGTGKSGIRLVVRED